MAAHPQSGVDPEDETRARNGKRLSWSVVDDEGRQEVLDYEPDGSWGHRLRVRLLGLLVPEGEL